MLPLCLSFEAIVEFRLRSRWSFEDKKDLTEESWEDKNGFEQSDFEKDNLS